MGLIDKKHVYSYSQLTTFEECPYAFYLQKLDKDIDKNDFVENPFAQQGTLIHDLIDQWAKGKIKAEDLAKEYSRRYPKEVDSSRWPAFLAAKGYAEKTYNDGLKYFTSFNKFAGYTIAATEQKFRIKLCDRPFVGVVDMILTDNLTGEAIILDHKRKSLSTFKREEKTIYRQQYLYANYFLQEYGCFPDILQFNLFLENGTVMEKKFSEKEYEETMKWAEETIKKMEEFDVFDWYETKMDKLRKKAVADGKDPNRLRLDNFCENICSCREICEERPAW